METMLLVDLPGEIEDLCCEHEADQLECDCPCHEPIWDVTPRPYDFDGAIISFPGGWEPDPEPPAACGLCGNSGADAEEGLCRPCLDRLPRVGGCGRGAALAVATAGDGGTAALVHLVTCPDCRQFFTVLAETAQVADMETSYADSLAAVA